jgi:hypothetical protein
MSPTANVQTSSLEGLLKLSDKAACGIDLPPLAQIVSPGRECPMDKDNGCLFGSEAGPFIAEQLDRPRPPGSMHIYTQLADLGYADRDGLLSRGI